MAEKTVWGANMQDDRKRNKVDNAYAFALGIATYCFAICEWNAVWLAERLHPGYVSSVEPKQKTAGKIAKDLLRLVDAISDPALKTICLPAAADFQVLVRERNALLPGKPGTATNGSQRLFRNGREWTAQGIEDFADSVTACSLILKDILHNYLK